jgi:hypothetical protein
MRTHADEHSLMILSYTENPELCEAVLAGLAANLRDSPGMTNLERVTIYNQTRDDMGAPYNLAQVMSACRGEPNPFHPSTEVWTDPAVQEKRDAQRVQDWRERQNVWFEESACWSPQTPTARIPDWVKHRFAKLWESLAEPVAGALFFSFIIVIGCVWLLMHGGR